MKAPYFALLVFAFIATSEMVLAEPAAAANITLEARLPEEIMLGLVYTSLFRVTNLDYMKGVDSPVNATVYYNVTRLDGSVYYESEFSKIINSYSYAGTGYLFMDELGTFQLCGAAAGKSACMNFTVIDPLQVPCNVSIGLSIGKFIFANNERVDLSNELFGNDEDYPFIIEYWVEDLLGGLEKKPINTSNLNEKTFTPKTDELDRVYHIKNRLSYIGCNNSNQDITSSAFFVVRNQDYSEMDEESQAPVKCPPANLKNKALIHSFYTRTKKYHEEISIYASVKSDYPTLLQMKTEFGSEWRKTNGSEKVSFFVKARPGGNFYELEAYVNDHLEDRKSLVVFLDQSLPQENDTQMENASDFIVKSNALENESKKVPTIEAQNTSATVILGASQEADSEPQEMPKTSMSPLGTTGSVVFQSPKKKVGSLAPYLIGAAILIGGIAFFRYKSR